MVACTSKTNKYETSRTHTNTVCLHVQDKRLLVCFERDYSIYRLNLSPHSRGLLATTLWYHQQLLSKGRRERRDFLKTTSTLSCSPRLLITLTIKTDFRETLGTHTFEEGVILKKSYSRWRTHEGRGVGTPTRHNPPLHSKSRNPVLSTTDTSDTFVPQWSWRVYSKSESLFGFLYFILVIKGSASMILSQNVRKLSVSMGEDYKSWHSSPIRTYKTPLSNRVWFYII